MKATVSEPASWKRVIDIEIPELEVQQAFNEKLEKYRKEIKLPGFRPGKVPAALIKQRYAGAIRAEIIDELVQNSYQSACKDNNITPVSAPKVNDLKAPEGETLKVSIETEVDPVIEVKDYNKLKIKATPKKIKDSDVDVAIKNLQERFAEFKDVERTAQKGDYVKLEYLKVSIDGEQHADIKAPNYPVELGGENRIKDFEKGISGHAAGEIIQTSVKFPKDYPDTQVAGKSGEFEIKILAVQEKSIPEINEELLKKIGNFADETALRTGIKEQLEHEENEKAKNEAYNKVIDSLIESNPFEVPPARLESVLHYMYEDAQRYQQPGTPAPSMEEFSEKYKDTAVRVIKRQRIIEFIADKENLKASQEEVDNEITRIAQMYNQPFEDLKQAFRRNGTTNRIRSDLREQKTLDFLIGESEKPAQ